MNDKVNIEDYESLDLLGIKDFVFIQNRKFFSFGTDAVLLARFAKINQGDICVDLCSGSGIVPVLICALYNLKSIYGVEIQEQFHLLAEKNSKINFLEDKFFPIHNNLIYAAEQLGKAKFQVVTINPPYKKQGSGIMNKDSANAAARHEILCTLEDCIKSAASLLSMNGRFYMVHRPERLADIFEAMKQYKIEPKCVQMVYPKRNKPPVMILIEGKKGTRPGGLKFLEPIILDENLEYAHKC